MTTPVSIYIPEIGDFITKIVDMTILVEDGKQVLKIVCQTAKGLHHYLSPMELEKYFNGCSVPF